MKIAFASHCRTLNVILRIRHIAWASSKLKRTIKSGYYDDALFVRLEQAVTTEYVQHIITDHYNNTTTIEQIKEELVSRKWAYKLLLGNLIHSF